MLGWLCRFEGPGPSDSLLVCADTVRVDSVLAIRSGAEVVKPHEVQPEGLAVTAEKTPIHVAHPLPSYRVPAPRRDAMAMKVVTGQMAVQHTAESMDWNLLVSHR